jgi:hypothetical protein
MGRMAANDDSHDKVILNCHAEANSVNDNHGNWSIAMAQVVSVKPLFLTFLVGVLLLGWSCGIVSATIVRKCWDKTSKRIEPAAPKEDAPRHEPAEAMNVP